MKALKIILIVYLAYAGVVVVFESLLGYFQPQSAETLVITTTAQDGTSSDRVLSRLHSDDQLYVAVNHWPRAWYRAALANPEVQIDLDGGKAPYRAIPVDGAEHDRVDSDNALGPVFRILTGFPPRYFLRLEPL